MTNAEKNKKIISLAREIEDLCEAGSEGRANIAIKAMAVAVMRMAASMSYHEKTLEKKIRTLLLAGTHMSEVATELMSISINLTTGQRQHKTCTRILYQE